LTNYLGLTTAIRLGESRYYTKEHLDSKKLNLVIETYFFHCKNQINEATYQKGF